MSTFELTLGTAPLLVCMPHIGTDIPLALRDGYVPRALAVEDTDWHLSLLYDFLDGVGASVLRATTSRYVIDLNRPPDDTPMYPGASNTELCPTRFFTGDPLYLPGAEPDLAQRMARRSQYWAPYHQALAQELNRLKALHGQVLLWDAHSIRSEIPWLFEGRLPDLNIGTADGQAADARVTQAVAQACQHAPGISSVVNGRFKGGYTTRHYGQPSAGIHAVQLEKCQSLYMEETPPFSYNPARAATCQPVLEAMLRAGLTAVQELPR